MNAVLGWYVRWQTNAVLQPGVGCRVLLFCRAEPAAVVERHGWLCVFRSLPAPLACLACVRLPSTLPWFSARQDDAATLRAALPCSWIFCGCRMLCLRVLRLFYLVRA